LYDATQTGGCPRRFCHPDRPKRKSGSRVYSPAIFFSPLLELRLAETNTIIHGGNIKNEQSTFRTFFHRHKLNPILTAGQLGRIQLTACFNPGATLLADGNNPLIMFVRRDRRGHSHLLVLPARQTVWMTGQDLILTQRSWRIPESLPLEELWGIERPAYYVCTGIKKNMPLSIPLYTP